MVRSIAPQNTHFSQRESPTSPQVRESLMHRIAHRLFIGPALHHGARVTHAIVAREARVRQAQLGRGPQKPLFAHQRIQGVPQRRISSVRQASSAQKRQGPQKGFVRRNA